MDEQKNTKVQSNLIRDILFVIRRNIILALAVIILVSGIGVGYSYLRKPNYVASNRVSFSIGGGTTASINEIRQYVDTVVDFCDEGVVLDRANAYYVEWVDYYKDQLKDVKEFYNVFEQAGQTIENPDGSKTIQYNDLFLNYTRPTANGSTSLKDETFLTAGNISTETAKNDDATNWVFNVKYTDRTEQDALEKIIILVLAYKHELYSDAQIKPYFTNLNVKISNLGLDGISKDVSKTKIIIIAVILGVVLSLLVVYLKNLFDNTVKEREDLERLTGVAVLGFITDRKEEANGK